LQASYYLTKSPLLLLPQRIYRVELFVGSMVQSSNPLPDSEPVRSGGLTATPAALEPQPKASRYGAPIDTGAKDGVRLTIALIADPEQLHEYVADWEDLAAHAIEPNIFYEHWFLIPAAKAFGAGVDLTFVFIFGTNPEKPTGPPILCGVFPLERRSKCVSLPVSTLSLWKHNQCFLCTPLLRKSLARETLDAFFSYLASESAHCSVLELKFVSGDGPFSHILGELLYKRALPWFVFESYPRAMMTPAADAETYLNTTISGRHRKELRRKEKRLGEQGALAYSMLEVDGDVEGWIKSFLDLEASGWKGVEGSALIVKESERQFFLRVAGEAFRRGRLLMLALTLDQQPVAQKCNFLAGNGAFAFKIAYDESRAEFSPGVLLEVENIRRIHALPGVVWMDSCAEAKHFMINRLWTERRTIQSIIVPPKGGWGEFLVSIMPLLRWFKRKLGRGNSVKEME
jgi:hypothetical protein